MLFIVAQVGMLMLASQEAAPAPTLMVPEIVIEGLQYVDGLAAGPDGSLFIANVPAGQIHIIQPDGTLRIFTTDSRGASGIAFGPDGHLYACESQTRAVSRWTMDGARTVLAERYEGSRFNNPKGICVDEYGGIYISDPIYGPVQGREIDTTDLYYIAQDGRPVQRVSEGLMNPDAIAASPDGKTLYVAVSGDGTIVAYDIPIPGVLTNQRVFSPTCGNAGISTDTAGNLLLATPDAIVVLDSNGAETTRYAMPTQANHTIYAGPAKTTLFASGPHAIFRLVPSPVQ